MYRDTSSVDCALSAEQIPPGQIPPGQIPPGQIPPEKYPPDSYLPDKYFPVKYPPLNKGIKYSKIKVHLLKKIILYLYTYFIHIINILHSKYYL